MNKLRLALFTLSLFVWETSIAKNVFLQHQLEPILIGESHSIAAKQVASPDLTVALYKANDFELVWANKSTAQEALRSISQSTLEGLSPSDYHYETLLNLSQQLTEPGSEAVVAQFDVLLSDAIMTYAKHLIRGKVNPKQLTPTWNYEQFHLSPDETAIALLEHIKANDVEAGLKRLKPTLLHYEELKKALAFYRNLQAQGELPPVVLAGKVLKAGESDPSVPLIKEKLRRLDYYEVDGSAQSNEYSDDLVEAIKKLQHFNQITEDGEIGKHTLSVLNTTYQTYVNTIMVNLERIRWVNNSLSERYVIVNIAGFKLFLYENASVKWQTNVVVGQKYKETPIFKGQMSHIVMNPTWTVPRSISKGIIEKAQNNPSYLAEKDFIVVDSKRNPVDINSIDWPSANQSHFPYWFVQQPSVNNALGQIKFIFPNQYSIYLHDTPAKSLFKQEQRAFSHGCVRVEDPFDFATQILQNSGEWPRSKIDEVIAAEATLNVNLADPLDVYLMYWTVSANSDELHFYPDVYERDAAVLERLNQTLNTDAI
jgi:murein L,D-transpeptidase YcbB/YkuD